MSARDRAATRGALLDALAEQLEAVKTPHARAGLLAEILRVERQAAEDQARARERRQRCALAQRAAARATANQVVRLQMARGRAELAEQVLTVAQRATRVRVAAKLVRLAALLAALWTVAAGACWALAMVLR